MQDETSGVGTVVCDVSRGTVQVADSFWSQIPAGFALPVVYDSLPFHAYHRRYAEKVVHIVFESNGREIGWTCAGVRGGKFELPYSAPFGMLYPRIHWCYRDVLDMCRGLKLCARAMECEEARVVLPPTIYSPDLIPCESTCLSAAGFSVDYVDLNHVLSLESTTGANGFSVTARQNLRKATTKGFAFQEVFGEGWRQAYDVIGVNRAERHHPLRIGEVQMADLMRLGVPKSRCFVVRTSGHLSVAAAIVFDVTPSVSQVVYWGDIGEYRPDNPMMILADGLIGVYSGSGKRFLDIGPSSDKGAVDCGLADFKRSVGCIGYSKLSFTMRTGAG